MGKKGTKRKTKWRALPLGEEAGGSGNEEDLHDEDQSTTSSVVGPPANTSKRQFVYYKMADKSYRQTKRFPYDRYRTKEPLVKLEKKTFDEEEYTKISTPRQDVLFKKGYFGRKRESSVEETGRHAPEADGEEPVMDQIIITNGFVDERGHYLVNGNSYEIYDPYSNTVTVVVGPPPYANGVTQPVLAAVSCQPVPLHPVDWYPPASDWPSQGSAWTPTYPRTPPANEPLPSPAVPPRDSPATAPAPAPAPYTQPPYLVPGFIYGESPLYDDAPLPANQAALASQATLSHDNGNDHKSKKTRRKSVESSEERNEAGKGEESGEEESVAEKESEMASEAWPRRGPGTAEEAGEAQPRQVEKQSHSTQTNSAEAEEEGEEEEEGVRNREKESHSTQTPPEKTFPIAKSDFKSESNKNLSEIILSSLTKLDSEGDSEATRKPRQKRHADYHKRFREDSPRKVYHQRTNFVEERKLKMENLEKADAVPAKMSYAKKAMSGLENSKAVNGTNPTSHGSLPNGVGAPQGASLNGTARISAMNGTKRTAFGKQAPRDRCDAFENQKNGNGHVKIDYGKSRSGRSSAGGKSGNERGGQKDSKYKRGKVCSEPFDADPEKSLEKKCEEIVRESRSTSEKSSTVSELSSPTELSSGQNTPPEKLIVRKMEQKIANEINKSFKEKLRQKSGEEKEEEKREGVERKEEAVEVAEGSEGVGAGAEAENAKGKAGEGKKKKKGKAEGEQGREGEGGKGGKSKKKKKKKAAGEGSKDKSSPDDNSTEDVSFLPKFFRQEPQDFLFEAWDGDRDLISEMDSMLTEDEDILKSLGIREDKMSFSKLPLHSDLLVMLPTLGWGRPKLNIKDFFASAHYRSDLFTRRNITSMKSTKPEEFFASVVDGPAAEKVDKKKEALKSGKRESSKEPEERKATRERRTASPADKKNGKTGYRGGKRDGRNRAEQEETREKEAAKEGSKEKKLGIVEAVSCWLQEQEDAEKVLSLDSVPAEKFSRLAKEKEEEGEREREREREEEEEEEDKGKGNKCVPAEKEQQKNGGSNPVRASSGSGRDREGKGAGFRERGGRIRVANVINDGFRHLDKELYSKRKSRKSRMYRSSSWDAKLADANIKKHFKFLTDSASFCQDLISDVRNGLPTKNEYATEELCDPKQSVSKYYTLAPGSAGPGARPRTLHDSDSENEVFDALEYKFLTKENLAKQEADAKSPDGTGNVSITDSGVHSDMDSSEDAANDHLKENTCKLQ